MNRRLSIIFIAVIALAAAVFVVARRAPVARLPVKPDSPGSQASGTATAPEPLVPPEDIIPGGPPPDGIPPIDDPKFVPATRAESFVAPDTLGLLVSVGKTSRFYPYNIMTWHEIVNDEIEGRPLTITFCPLCASGFVFERRLPDGRVLDFGTSGKLYQSNLVMYDRQTGSLWPQVLMKAVIGPLTGTELELYPATVTSFAKAREARTGLEILSTDTGHFRDYRRNPYQGYEESEDIYFPVDRKDARLPAKELVYAIPLDGKFKAYRWADLVKRRSLKDSIGSNEIEISLGAADLPTVTDLANGRRVVGFHAFWFSVAAVHPDIEVWAAE